MDKPVIRALLFDLDGTLANTMQDLAAATNRALEQNGFPACPLSAYAHMVGNGARKLIERSLGKAATPELTERVLADFLRIYDNACMVDTRPYDGLPEALSVLKARGLRMAVVTNKPEPQARKIVDQLFSGVFEAVYGGRPGRKPKPDPSTALEAAEKLGASPEETLFIGDSDVDIFTSKAANMQSIGCGWGFRGIQELCDAGADFPVNSPQEMLQCILHILA